jgi:hypothetical protein
VTFENLPTALPAASGGLPTIGTGSGQISLTAGGVDVQTIKTQAVTCAAGVTINPYLGNASAALQVDTSGYVKVSAGTGTGQLSLASGVALANATQFGGQPVSAAAGITVGPFLGNAGAALQVDVSGYVKVSSGMGTGQINLTTGAVPVTGTVTLAAVTHTGAIIPTVSTVTSGVAVATNNDKTGYMLAPVTHTGAIIPTVSTVTSGVTVATNNDKTGYMLAPVTHTGATIPTVTDLTNVVTVGTNNDKTGYSLNLSQAVPTSNTAQTIGDALNAARAQGFGKWVLSGTTLTLYASDGTTAVRTFTLDSASAPTQRA